MLFHLVLIFISNVFFLNRDVKELGRFTLRYAGVTIAAGVITKVM